MTLDLILSGAQDLMHDASVTERTGSSDLNLYMMRGWVKKKLKGRAQRAKLLVEVWSNLTL